MSLDAEKLKIFLDYKKNKIDILAKIERRRLQDLGHSRDVLFKYAFPISLIDGIAGGLAALLTKNILIFLPVTILVILIYIMADNLDLQKVGERLDIVRYTDRIFDTIREQENELLRRAEDWYKTI
jgi:hypothetical protein